MNRAIAVVQGQNGERGKSVNEHLDQIDKALQKPATARAIPPEPQRKAGMEPTSDQFTGWAGVRAPNKTELKKALPAMPDGETPVWIYTPDKQAAEAPKKQLQPSAPQ